MPGDAATARNNLAITPSNIGAAPAGYGVGSQAKHLTSADDLHALTIGGRYRWASDAPQNSPGQHLVMDLMFRDQSGTYGVADFYTTSPFAIYQSFGRIIISDGEWGEFEWENPPLHTDKEYRTTERFDDKVVFKKKDSNGKMMYRLDGNSTWIEGLPGAAPSGYGLGGAAYTADLNKATKPGWYYTDPNTANTGRYYTAVHVKAWKDNSMIEQVQTDLNLTNFDRLHRYSKDSGATWTEEWENPLMQVGVAYQTTERWNGKPVYAKLIDIGYLPNATSKNIDGVIESGVDDLVELKCILKSGYVRRNSDGLVDVHLGVENPYAWLTVKTTSDMSAYTGKVLIKWTRP